MMGGTMKRIIYYFMLLVICVQLVGCVETEPPKPMRRDVPYSIYLKPNIKLVDLVNIEYSTKYDTFDIEYLSRPMRNDDLPEVYTYYISQYSHTGIDDINHTQAIKIIETKTE